MITIDFESRSKCPLRTAGAWRYAADPTTEVLCLGYAIDGCGPHIWVPGDDLPEELFYWLSMDSPVEAHHAFFEKAIWRNIMVKRFGWPDIPDNQWTCTAARAAALALPRSLDEVGRVLNLKNKKDATWGKQTMLKLARPRTPTASNPSGWHENAQDFKDLYTYCLGDVAAEVELGKVLRPLTPTERKVWLLDQKINERGIRVDRRAVECALKLLTSYSETLYKEFRTLTGGMVHTVLQRDKLILWLSTQGVPTEKLAKADVQDLLETSALPAAARRVLEIRQALSRTSTAKYTTILGALNDDDRLRDLLMYHGASTGRWTGKLVQPQNFPRQTLKKGLETCFEILKTGDLDAFELCYPDVMGTLSGVIRGVFIPADGHTFFGGDFASIEARVLFWLAGEEKGLEMFRRGDDLYKDLASVIYRKPVAEVTKAERELGKRGILGCLAKNTRVYSDSGIKYIQDIKPNDKLWDGKEWVKHEGLLQVGSKRVMHKKYLGIESTRDHLFLTHHGWQSAEEIAITGGTKLRIRGKSLASGQYRPWSFYGVQNAMSVFAAAAHLNRVLESTTYGAEKLRGALSVLNLLKAKEGETQIETLTSSLIHAFAPGGSLRTTTLKNVVAIRDQKISRTIILGEFASPSNPVENSWNTLYRCLVGITGPSLSIVLRTKMDTEKVISEWSAKRKTIETKEKECYDILNSGPRLRFRAENWLAHNCGYGMGKVKFKDSCWTYARMAINEEMAEKVVNTYREKYNTVCRLWANQNSAAMQAVANPGFPVKSGKVTWMVKDKYLFCALPSGRLLAYYDPKIEPHETSWGETKDTVTYMSVNSVSKKWERTKTYGGKIVENLCQAVARDLMAEAMLRIESAGFKVVLTVHDEILAEHDDKNGAGVVKAFENLMAELPVWAAGLPVKAEGWQGKRYQK